MFTIFLVGIPVILVNMLLQSLVSVWCSPLPPGSSGSIDARAPWPACWPCLASSPW